MNVNGVTQGYYSQYLMTNKNVKSGAKFAVNKTNNIQDLSEAEELEDFKKEFYEDLSKVTNHRTVSNVAVNISDAAFQAMKADPKYRQQVLSLIQRDLGDSYAPRNCSVMITVGATLNEYRGDSWPVGYDNDFHKQAQNSFYKRIDDKKDSKKEIEKNCLRKREQVKKQQQKILEETFLRQKQESKRLLQLWSMERNGDSYVNGNYR